MSKTFHEGKMWSHGMYHESNFIGYPHGFSIGHDDTYEDQNFHGILLTYINFMGCSTQKVKEISYAVPGGT